MKKLICTLALADSSIGILNGKAYKIGRVNCHSIFPSDPTGSLDAFFIGGVNE